MFQSYEDYARKKQEEEEEIQAILSDEAGFRKIIFRILLVVIAVIILFNLPAKKPYKVYDGDFKDIPEPIQEDTSGNITIDVKGVPVTLTYWATYQITGRVLKTADYFDYDTENRLIPIDVALGWSYMANDYARLDFYTTYNRGMGYITYDTAWYNSHGREENITKSWSNNHLIASNKEIRKLFDRIKTGDYIQIEGYLVEARWQEGRYQYKFGTSTTRDDVGGYACETIYVTSLKWLKEKGKE